MLVHDFTNIEQRLADFEADPQGDREAYLIAAVRAYDKELETWERRAQTHATKKEELQAENARLRAALESVRALPHSNPTKDNLHGPCPTCIAEDALSLSPPQPTEEPDK